MEYKIMPGNSYIKFYIISGVLDLLFFFCPSLVITTTDPEARVRFPALPDVLRSSGSATGSTQPEELLGKKVAAPV
jgi:hypothetical protein